VEEKEGRRNGQKKIRLKEENRGGVCVSQNPRDLVHVCQVGTEKREGDTFQLS
jgi:hypothetical protein